MIKKALLLFAVCLGLAVPSSSATEFTYRPTGSSELSTWGTTRTETYDVAIKIDAPSLVGSKIKSVRIPVNQTDSVYGYSVWLSSELKLDVVNKKKVNAPDITTVSATPENGEVVVNFDETYTIPESGLYVGYSFTVTKLTDDYANKPIVGAATASENGFYIHASRSYLKWMDKSETESFTAAINVVLDGNFPNNAATIKSLANQNVKANDKASLSLSIANYGMKPISSLDFSYAIGADTKGTSHLDLTEAIPANLGNAATVSFEIPGYDLLGVQDLAVSIDKVNGEVNTIEGNSAQSTITYYSFIPVHRSVEEEYTDLLCGWCTRGFAALEHMSNNYPDFIGIAYHGRFSGSDPMELSSTYPNEQSSFPMAIFDRKEKGDPFYGVNQVGDFPVENEWLERCAEIASAAVDVNAAFQSKGSDIIDVNTTVTFASALDSINYKLTYVLVADDMTGEKWSQSNYYAQYSNTTILGETGIEELADFGAGGKYGETYISGLHFNDVAIYVDDVYGIDNTIPTSVKNLEAVNHNYKIDINKAVNNSGDNLVQNREKLRVVALLLDATTGYIVNAARADVKAESESGIGSTIINSEVVKSEYYDLSGRRIITPSNGIYVKRVTYDNGAVQTSKVVVR
jgi:hypothetical protein